MEKHHGQASLGNCASPHQYADAEITALMTATSVLSTSLRRATLATLIGLLTVTDAGREAVARDRGDVDLTGGRVIVRFGKVGKPPRNSPCMPGTIRELRSYRRLPDRCGSPTGSWRSSYWPPA
jgi:hypothetical protein